nr:uncharacterized protein LOC101247991 isoform X3 [Solanum lycopersicum]
MIFLVISLNLLGAYSCSGSWYILIYYWVIPLEQCSCAFSESNDECLYCKCRMRYFKDSNFLPRRKFGITCFENSYARDFVKYAAEQFGRDHQEIANMQQMCLKCITQVCESECLESRYDMHWNQFLPCQ